MGTETLERGHRASSTENETNHKLLSGGANPGYVKDGINDHVVHGSRSVNPEQAGSKCAAHYRLQIGAGQSKTAEFYDLELAEVIVDAGESAKSLDRPGLKRGRSADGGRHHLPVPTVVPSASCDGRLRGRST